MANIKLNNKTYPIPDSKLATATGSFITHLGTIAGNGLKVVIGGVEYGVDAAKVAGAVAEFEGVLGGLNSGGTNEGYIPELNEYGFMYNNLYTCAEADATVIFYEDGSALTTMNGSETPIPAGYISYSEGVIDMSLLGYGAVNVSSDGLILEATDMGVDFYAEVTHGDYRYRYNYVFDRTNWYARTAINGWGVCVLDDTKTSYGEILSSIAGKPVTSLLKTFEDCTSLVNAPTIPNSVTEMLNTFVGCTSLVNAPAIPNSVIDMTNTFDSCTSLVNAPTIPNSVTRMNSTFGSCTSLVNAPTIPNSVTEMNSTFVGCTSLVNAPAIPNSVTEMNSTFRGCIALTGEIEINANPTSSILYHNCFYCTEKPITITGSTTLKAELAATANNGNVTFVA